MAAPQTDHSLPGLQSPISDLGSPRNPRQIQWSSVFFVFCRPDNCKMTTAIYLALLSGKNVVAANGLTKRQADK